MTINDNFFDELGTHVAKDLAEFPDADRIGLQRHHFLSKFEDRNTGRFPLRMLIAAALVVVIPAILIFFFGQDDRRSFWIGDAHQTGHTGEMVTSEFGETTSVAFDNGSQFILTGNSLMQVEEATQEKVEVSLKQGELTARINGNGITRWFVIAGPYRVEVLGTKFTVDWSAARSIFALKVKQGRVTVRGAGLEKEGVTMTSGQRMLANGKQRKYTITNAMPSSSDVLIHRTGDDETKASGPSSPAASHTEGVLAESSTSAKTVLPRNSVNNQLVAADEECNDEVKAIRSHLSKGETELALQLVSTQGIASVMNELTKDELWNLAEFARYDGQGALASMLLVNFRNRSVRDGRYHTATFLLGKIEIDLRGRPSKARDWFQLYLKEQPTGSLAEEALGRLVDACHRAKMYDDAQRFAQRYFQLYPSGPFSKVIEAMLQKNQKIQEN